MRMRHFVVSVLVPLVVASVESSMVCADSKSTSVGEKLPYSSLAASDLGYEHLAYVLPKDAVRTGPFGLRSSGLRTKVKQYYLYSDPTTGDRVGREVFVVDRDKKTRTRVKLELYKHKLLHGVQKEWYDDGKPKSIAPWKKYIMHGTFKHWDKNGKLIGWYKIINGQGIRRLYHSNGRPFREIPFRFNREHGAIRTIYENGQIRTISQKRYHEFFGMSVSFWPDGRFRSRAWSDSEGQFHGPVILNETGAKQKQRSEITYYVHGMKVSKKQYVAVAERDSTLPKRLEDPETYKQLSERTKRIIEHYKNVKPLKIPLEAPTADKAPFDVPIGRK